MNVSCSRSGMRNLCDSLQKKNYVVKFIWCCPQCITSNIEILKIVRKGSFTPRIYDISIYPALNNPLSPLTTPPPIVLWKLKIHLFFVMIAKLVQRLLHTTLIFEFLFSTF